MSAARLSLPPAKLSPAWLAWIKDNFARGSNPTELYTIMRNKGFGLGQIKAGLAKAYPDISLDPLGRDGSARFADYSALAACALTRTEHPDLRRVPTQKAQLYVWKNFLSAEACAELRRLTDLRLQDSTISGEGDPKYARFRTSRTCMIEEMGSPLVDQLGDKISKALGLSQAWSEPNQAQKYEIGQEFKAHTDYYEPGAEEYDQHCKILGQRTWTFMIYLNTVEAGGATRFRKLEKQFRPMQGQAVIWNSLTPEGDPNPWTLHHGLKVREGEKYVITKWFHDKGEGPMLRSDR
ncbi:MAG: 2OG-Fe(II) oxygenase, partial [Pseudomonadota bacterium]